MCAALSNCEGTDLFTAGSPAELLHCKKQARSHFAKDESGYFSDRCLPCPERAS